MTRQKTCAFDQLQNAKLSAGSRGQFLLDFSDSLSSSGVIASDPRFARPPIEQGDLRLFFGNPHAEMPNYDFARNLPEKLDLSPVRVGLGDVQRNPSFVPPPLAITERFPWLIYVVLSSVSVVLAGVIVSVSRTAIAIHDNSGQSAVGNS